MVNIKFIPEWAKFEKGMTSADTKTQNKSAEAFDETRKAEIAKSAKAAQWEKERKKEWAKNKPKYVKDRLKKDQEPFNRLKQEIMAGGKHDAYFEPTPNYILIKPDEATESESGIILPEFSGVLPNEGEVMAAGGVFYSDKLPDVFHPVNVGDRVLFKKGAGMDIELKYGKCKLMLYTDILGKLFND